VSGKPSRVHRCVTCRATLLPARDLPHSNFNVMQADRSVLRTPASGGGRLSCRTLARAFATDRVFAVRLRLLVDMPKLLSIGAAQQRAATTQKPAEALGRWRGEERAGQARATIHAPFKRQVERKITPGEGLFSLRYRSSNPTTQAC
jgi:hypothetical protein